MSPSPDVPSPGATSTDVAQLRSLVERTRPVSSADEQALPVSGAFEAMLPAAGLRRGSFVQVCGEAGATSLALALAAGPSRAGSWVAVLGGQHLGWAAAAELGLQMDRVAVIDADAQPWLKALAALIDAFDVVLVATGRRADAREVRQLRARARERGTVLVMVPTGVGAARHWEGSPDLRLEVVGGRWAGLGQGWGRLRSRTVTVEVSGRGAAARGARYELQLPDAQGRVVLVGPSQTDAAVTPLRRVG